MTHRPLELNGHTFVVSHPDHRALGDSGPTKMELLRYYMTVAPRMLPFLRGRPASAVLLPDDTTQEFRFASTAPPGWPRRLPTYGVPCVNRSRTERYLTVPDCDTLAALVNYGCLSFHPWSSTAAALFQPTQIVFNLDPEAIAFREVRSAALLLRDLLGVYGLAAWVKTSGGHGLHVVVPVRGSASFADVRLVADTVVSRAIRREPTLFSRDLRPARRRGRILLDTSRNDRGASIIAPYGVAASGLVSAPLEWDELRRPIYPDDFDMDRVMARGDTDLANHAAFFAVEQSLERLLRSSRSYRSRIMAGRPPPSAITRVQTFACPTRAASRRACPASEDRS